MEYHQAVNFLFDLRRFQVKPGVASVRSLLSELDDPHSETDFVQIAGSNGKGSTARMVESVLREAGFRVGLFTSPHLDDLRERIRVDGRKITERAICEFVAETKPWLVERAADGDPLTFFETMTAMALWYFERADVDVAVLEVGMGGELDATSVVDPVAAAVTNVTLEHTEILGDTVEEIATTKAHVAPADEPLVTAATGDALAAVRAQAGDVLTVGEGPADAADAPDVAVTYGGRVNHTESTVSVAGDGWAVETRLPLLGSFQARNAGIASVLARQTAEAVARRRGVEESTDDDGTADDETGGGHTLDEADLARGLRKAYWPGRFEVMERDPMVVLDGAHNPEACEELADVLAEFEYDRLHLVFGAMHDKDARGMAAALPTPDSVLTCEPVIDRAEDPEVLARVFEDAGVADVAVGGAVASALAAARERAAPGDCVLLTGSLFCVAEARIDWTRATVPKTVRDLDDATAVLEGANAAARDVAADREGAVHRVLKTRVQFGQARTLRAEMLAAGGDCTLSGQQREGDLLDVVLAGTLGQFGELARRLADRTDDLAAIGEEVRRRAAIDAGEPTHGYPWEDRPAVMGILNVTPDSFHDGGEYADPADAVARAGEMIEAGVDVVDVGGESTRPGATAVPTAVEKERVVPVVEALADADVLVSVDTRKADVARAALEAGADVLNDVTGLEDPEMRFLAAEWGVPIVVMHSVDAPVVPGKEVPYDDVVEDVIEALEERVLLAEQAGVPREKIIVDPGLGFGKTRAENFEILGRLGEFRALGCPVLVGHSHKSMFDLVGAEAGERADATVAATALAVDRGADVVRIHDVARNVDAVNVARALADPDSLAGE
ncbi:MAG: dihydropteroate synthase [Salinigranum sp.]